MPSLKRRAFLTNLTLGSAALGLAGSTAGAASLHAGSRRRMLMKVGHQHDDSDETLRTLAAFGVNHICSGRTSADMNEWTVEALTRLRQRVESFGITLAAVPLPLPAHEISSNPLAAVLLDKQPARDEAVGNVCRMIRNAGSAGIPLLTYNFSYIGMVRSGTVIGRGGAKCNAFDYASARQEPPLTIAGPISETVYWDRITYFLKRVVPVAEEAKVRIALHPQDPGMPKGKGYRGVETVLGSVDGLKRFIETVPSPYHGLNFCQGTISEMLEIPGEQIYDVIRWFGRRGKIFNVHFRNIHGGFLGFNETFPDDGDVDMPRALRVYRDCGYDGMIMPDHAPEIAADTNKQRAFAFCFGYIQALLQQLRSEA